MRAAAGFVRRPALTCDICGANVSAQMFPIHCKRHDQKPIMTSSQYDPRVGQDDTIGGDARERRATVYVPNMPARRDPESGEWRPSMNLHPAEKHGKLLYLFSHEEAQAGAAPCEAIVDRRMAGIAAEDCILFVGDPSLMAIVVRAHARLLPGVRMNLLKWDRFARDYIKVSLK